MLLMHGTADTIVSPSQTDLLYQALQQNGIPSERYLVTGAAHGGKYWVQEPVLNVISSRNASNRIYSYRRSMSWPSLLKGVVLMTNEELALLLAFLQLVVSIIALLK